MASTTGALPKPGPYWCGLEASAVGAKKQVAEIHGDYLFADGEIVKEARPDDLHITLHLLMQKKEFSKELIGLALEQKWEPLVGKWDVFEQRNLGPKRLNYDVVILRLEIPQDHPVKKLHLKAVEESGKPPVREFNPHLTLVYTQPGYGKKWIKDRSDEQIRVHSLFMKEYRGNPWFTEAVQLDKSECITN